jgi:hypothetical protein
MPYISVAATQKAKSATPFKGEIRERPPAEYHFTSNIFSYDKIGEERKQKFTSSNVIELGTVIDVESNQSTAWQKTSSNVMFADKIDLTLVSRLFSNVDRYIRGFPIEDTQILSQTDRALGFLYERIKALSDGFFCNIRSIPPSRSPGFVIDGWIVIPKYERNLEYKIYKELGNIIHNNPNLLFNIHIIARKGRELSKILPEDFKRYNPWPGYIC